MKKLATAIAAIALIGTPALAADMAVKAPPPVAAAVYSWTGWYVGGNIGYSWGDAHTDLTGNGTTTTTVSPPTPALSVPFAFAHSDTARLNGVIGGAQLGYNYQFSPNWVLGFEADFRGSGQRGSSTFTDPFSTAFCFIFVGAVCEMAPNNGLATAPGTAMTSYQAEIDWFGTVRARLGYLMTDQVLIYGTGGLAYGRVSVSGSTNVFATPSPSSLPLVSQAVGFGASKTNVGFSVGGGIEGKLRQLGDVRCNAPGFIAA